MLAELRTYIMQKGRVSLKDLVDHFHVEAGALQGMMQKWIHKGYVRKSSQTTQCGTQCCRCDATLTEFYEWIDASLKATPNPPKPQ